MNYIEIKSFGPINKGKVEIGDLTLLVGPQANGKSIFLQLLKLLIDKDHIRQTLEQYGYIWGEHVSEIMERCFGEGMGDIWRKETAITLDSKKIDSQFLLDKETTKNSAETLFYIPAQRVVCLQNGWPRYFSDYEDGVPYVLKHFSESLRRFLESGFSRSKNDVIFPLAHRLNESLRNSFNRSIFHDAKILIDKTGKKRFKLEAGKSSIAYMAWSAGQKEFMPLLLSFYWLCSSPGNKRKDSLSYVVIEEPEMGLHPQGIMSVLLQVMDLMNRGYKVIISTHSPVLLEFAWAIQLLKESGTKAEILFDLFDMKRNADLATVFEIILKEKIINTYSFGRENDKVNIKNISTLDAASEDAAIAEWGGLSSFSTRASELVSKSIAR